MSNNVKNLLKSVVPLSALLLPLILQAQNFTAVYFQISSYLNDIIVFLMLLATVLFLYGVVKYIAAGGDEDAIKTGRTFMIYGIIGLAVMVAVWGFVNVLLTFIFTTDNPAPFIPPGPHP